MWPSALGNQAADLRRGRVAATHKSHSMHATQMEEHARSSFPVDTSELAWQRLREKLHVQPRQSCHRQTQGWTPGLSTATSAHVEDEVWENFVNLQSTSSSVHGRTRQITTGQHSKVRLPTLSWNAWP